MSAIDEYLGELTRRLRLCRAPGKRLVLEVEDHLREATAEAVAVGVPPVVAEQQAVERFGDAADVAARFAEAAALTVAKRSVAAAALAVVAYAGVAAAFAIAASPLMRDFPQGAPTFFGLQLALVALGAAWVRVLYWRRELAMPATELRVVTRSTSIATASVLFAAVLEAALALARPAGFIAWSEAPALVVAVGCAFVLAAASAIVATRASAQRHALDALPRSRRRKPAEQPRDHGRGARAAAAILSTVERRPWTAAITAAMFAVALVAAMNLAGSDSAHHASILSGAVVAGSVEAGAIIVGFAAFSRMLGLREPVVRRGLA